MKATETSMSNKVRIATVSETGQRHIVDRIDFRAGLVHCLPGVSKVSYDRHSGELAKTAHVVGDIWHDILAVDAGAFLEGHCKPNEAQPTIRPAVSRPAEVVAGTEGTTKSVSSN